MLLAGIAGYVSLWFLRVGRWRPALTQAEVVINDAGVDVGGYSFVAKAAIRSASLCRFLPDRPAGVRIWWGEDRSVLDLVGHDEEEAARILWTLGHAPAQRTTEFVAIRRSRSKLWWLVTTLMCMLLVAAVTAALWSADAARERWRWELLPVFALFAGYMYLDRIFAGVRVDVGNDGLIIRDRRGAPTVVPYADLEDVKRSGIVVKLRLRSGQIMALQVWTGFDGWSAKTEDADALKDRILSGLEAWKSGAHQRVDAQSLVAQGERDVKTWIDATSTLLHGEASHYRVVPVARDTLWAIAEDGSAEPTARVGAALALRSELDEDGRARLRAVSMTSVIPNVRVGLGSIANAEDDALLEEALAHEAHGERAVD